MHRRVLALAGTGALAIAAVAGCGGANDPGDYASGAEDYIEGDLADEPGVGGLQFTGATCVEPASSDVGATFTCTATGSDGQAYSFQVSIIERDTFQVDRFDVLPGGIPATTTTVAGDPAATSTSTTTTTVAG